MRDRVRTLGAILYPNFELLDLYGPVASFLAKADLVDGRRATSNKQFFSLATAQSDTTEWVEKARWVEDGPFVTSSGVSAGIDMSLAVIARLWGRERAETIANLTEYEWHTDSTRGPFHRFLNQAAAMLANVQAP